MNRQAISTNGEPTKAQGARRGWVRSAQAPGCKELSGARSGWCRGMRMSALAPFMIVMTVAAALATATSQTAAAQTVADLCGPSDVQQFDDVFDDDYGADYIWCARVLRLSRGTGAGNFEPKSELTRAQMAAFLIRLWRDTLGRTCPSQPTHTFNDISGNFAEADIECLYALGITKGTTSTTYSPSRSLNPAAITRFLARMINMIKPGTCDLSGNELSKAAACLARERIAPNTVEPTATSPATRAQMVVYLIGAWHHATSSKERPVPPERPA